MRNLFLLLVAVLSLTSCTPPDGCFYKSYITGTEVIVDSRIDALGRYRESVRERPIRERLLICSPEDELTFDEIYTIAE